MDFRFAKREDCSLILKFIKDLASYEEMANEVIADEKTLEEWIFDKQKAEVIFALSDNTEVGFALFFIIFPLFWDVPEYIWKTCMSSRSTAKRGMAKLF